MLADYIGRLVVELEALPAGRRMAFAAAVVRQLEPLYVACAGYRWCRPDLFAYALQRVMEHAAGGPKVSPEEAKALQAELLEHSPDLEECVEYGALDACSALAFALRSCDGSSACAASVAEVALENAGRQFENSDWATSGWADPEVQRAVEAQLCLLRNIVAS